MEDVKEKVEQIQQTLDAGVEKAVATAKSALAGNGAALWHTGEECWEYCQARASSALAQAEVLQDQAFDAAKLGIEYCLLHPYIFYPAAGAALVVALPGVRRFAYNITLGRLRSPESIVASAEAKLSTLGAKADEIGAETKKLQERAQMAHEQWLQGLQKLKAARQELQRLELSAAKSERLARTVLQDLRRLQQSRAMELRSEAAMKLSLLRQQRASLQKEIKWIVKNDV